MEYIAGILSGVISCDSNISWLLYTKVKLFNLWNQYFSKSFHLWRFVVNCKIWNQLNRYYILVYHITIIFCASFWGDDSVKRRYCKDLLETDRQIYATERGYECYLTKIIPVNSSPKNDLIVGVSPKHSTPGLQAKLVHLFTPLKVELSELGTN